MANHKTVKFIDGKYPDAAVGEKLGLLGDMDIDRQKRLADLETKIRRRRECEDRAHRVVLLLIVNPITEEFLTDAAQFLNTSHYTDVTEERAIGHLCGYPICPKPLPKQPKKKYHISLAHNKLYDITDRKNFCSNQCYKASKHFEQQISPTAVWAREGQPPILFDILPLDDTFNCRGIVGHELMISPSAAIERELKALEERDRRAAIHDAKEGSAAVKMGMSSAMRQTHDMEELRIDQLAQHVSDMLLIEGSVDGHDLLEGLVGESEVCDAEEDEALKPLTRINDNCERVSDVAYYDKRTAPLRTVDLRSNDPMVPVRRLDPVRCGESEARQVGDTINSKAKLLTALLDQRDTLRGSVISCPSKSATDNRCMASNANPIVTQHAPCSVSGARMIENIRHVNTQQEAARKSIAKKKSRKMPHVSPLLSIQKYLLEWRTTETSAYLNKGGKVDDRTEFAKKYAALGARVRDMSGLIGETGMDQEDPRLNPIPDMAQLKHDTQQLELKVCEFYKGNMRYPVVDLDADTDPVPDRPAKDENPKDGEKAERDPMMPLLDTHSQIAIRRKIVFGQLNRVLPDLLRPLRLALQDIAVDLRQLVNTFSFTATNIVLKSGEWTLIAFCLLRLLALRMSMLEAAFRVPQTEAFFMTMLASLGITEQMIQAVLNDVMSTSCNDPSRPSASTSQAAPTIS